MPTVTAHRSELHEAAAVAAAARLAKRPGRPWSAIAVLARTNGQLEVLLRALDAAGIPARVSGERAQLGRPHVKAALEEAATATNRAALMAWASDLAAAVEGRGEAAGEMGSEEARIELAELARAVMDYMAEDVSPSGPGFRNWLETTVLSGATDVRPDAVELATFHRSKGLEWAVVFVTGLEDGFVPIFHARSPEALAEERRLLYVACTRAVEELHCSWAAERTFSSGRPSPRKPSPWLTAIEGAERELRRVSRASSSAARQALAESRRLLGLPDPPGATGARAG